jgi:hypothetical protein
MDATDRLKRFVRITGLAMVDMASATWQKCASVVDWAKDKIRKRQGYIPVRTTVSATPARSDVLFRPSGAVGDEDFRPFELEWED